MISFIHCAYHSSVVDALKTGAFSAARLTTVDWRTGIGNGGKAKNDEQGCVKHRVLSFLYHTPSWRTSWFEVFEVMVLLDLIRLQF